MMNIKAIVLVLFVFPIQAASWSDRVGEWLEQEVPACATTSQQRAWMQQYASQVRSQDEVIIPVAPFYNSTKTLATMLNGSHYEQLQAGTYLQEAIDNNTLTPKTRLLVVQHAVQLHIPRDEKLTMLSELLENADHTIKLAALRIAEKEMSESDFNETCWCIAGTALSGLSATLFGPFAGSMSALATILSLRDPACSILFEKITAVKATLAKTKLKTE